MLVSVLASGSKGNSCLIKTNHAKILIDFGMSTKYIKDQLKEIDIDLNEIDYLLITHTHKDHVAGIKTYLKRYSPCIVLSSKMLDDLDYLQDYSNLLLDKDELIIGDTKIEHFKTSHDTNDSRGYIITETNSSMVYVTDTGYLNQKNFNKLKNKNLYVFESNHDVEMLMNGRYPSWLKTRVLSDYGHLSNNAAGYYLSKLIGNETKNVILAHLSEENNDENIALTTVLSTLKEHDVDFSNISIAKQRTRTEVFVI